MVSSVNKQLFFAITLQDHRYQGKSFNTHILKLFNEKAGIYTVQENIHIKNLSRWQTLLPPNAETLLMLVDQISEKNIFKVIGKGKGTTESFFNDLHKNESIQNYVRNYIDQRINKIYDIITRNSIPTFVKEKRFNNIYDDNRLIYYSTNANPLFRFVRKTDELLYSLSASCNGEKIDLKTNYSEIICYSPCIVRVDKKLLRFDDIDAKKLQPFFTKSHVSIPKTVEKKYFESFVRNVIRDYMVEAEGFEIVPVKPSPNAILSLEPTLTGKLVLILKFNYGEKHYLCHTIPEREVNLSFNSDNIRFTRFDRDTAWEKEMINRCELLDLECAQGSSYLPKILAKSNDEQIDYELIHWLNEQIGKIQEIGFSVSQNHGKAKYYIDGFDLSIHTKTENDWFDIYGVVKFRDFEIPFTHFRRNILKGIKEFPLPNGEIFVLPQEWFARYRDVFHFSVEDDTKLKLKKHHFGLLHSVDKENIEVKEISELFSKIKRNESAVIPFELKAQLRDYQKEGLLWMQLLHRNGFNGCLADDMGLGKTVQTIAMLQYVYQKMGNGTEVNGNKNCTSLIVVPTSLLFNWQNEISRFAPSLAVYQFAGQNRARNATIFKAFDVVITTYGVLRNDIDLIKEFEFCFAIFDESQTIKNPSSKGYIAATEVKAAHFIALSGTPIENSLTDLWSQMNLVNRGILGSLSNFSKEYITPIENRNDLQSISKLKKMVEPFILRRTKEQVAKDLPEKTEQILYCDLTEEQKHIYETEKSSIRNFIIENISNQGYSKSSILILRALTRLRQLANHPVMVEPAYVHDSGKYNEIIRSIETVVSEGHKILIFSSFVKHLNVIQGYLSDNQIDYRMLIGSTTNREKTVSDFQNNPKVKVFLISIKAGGTGLNLTAADYIFVLDPWWNPAVENQAISRAHRIGQDKKVFVYRFISVDTVEEKILNLQKRKVILAESFIGNNNPLSIFSREQVLEIIS